MFSQFSCSEEGEETFLTEKRSSPRYELLGAKTIYPPLFNSKDLPLTSELITPVVYIGEYNACYRHYDDADASKSFWIMVSSYCASKA